MGDDPDYPGGPHGLTRELQGKRGGGGGWGVGVRQGDVMTKAEGSK